jgi:hypothetical protein
MFGFTSNTVRSLAVMALITMSFVGAASAGTTYKTNIDQMSGWQHCSACAGANGNGSVAPYSMQQHVSSPSMDGKATKFNLGGTNNYSNAYWWKKLDGADSTKHHFKYDLYFYMKNPRASQALEFDVNQALGGRKYIFGTQCSMVRGTFDIYSKAAGWIHTSIPCTAARTAYKWHHLVWEFQRTSDKRVKYVSVTLDGKKHYINKTFNSYASSYKQISIAFQMDGNKYQTDYSTWLDKVKLTYW